MLWRSCLENGKKQINIKTTINGDNFLETPNLKEIKRKRKSQLDERVSFLINKQKTSFFPSYYFLSSFNSQLIIDKRLK